MIWQLMSKQSQVSFRRFHAIRRLVCFPKKNATRIEGELHLLRWALLEMSLNRISGEIVWSHHSRMFCQWGSSSSRRRRRAENTTRRSHCFIKIRFALLCSETKKKLSQHLSPSSDIWSELIRDLRTSLRKDLNLPNISQNCQIAMNIIYQQTQPSVLDDITLIDDLNEDEEEELCEQLEIRSIILSATHEPFLTAEKWSVKSISYCRTWSPI